MYDLLCVELFCRLAAGDDDLALDNNPSVSVAVFKGSRLREPNKPMALATYSAAVAELSNDWAAFKARPLAYLLAVILECGALDSERMRFTSRLL